MEDTSSLYSDRLACESKDGNLGDRFIRGSICWCCCSDCCWLLCKVYWGTLGRAPRFGSCDDDRGDPVPVVVVVGELAGRFRWWSGLLPDGPFKLLVHVLLAAGGSVLLVLRKCLNEKPAVSSLRTSFEIEPVAVLSLSVSLSWLSCVSLSRALLLRSLAITVRGRKFN